MAIGWGIIGIGSHADRSFGPGIKRAENTEFVAVCSRSMEKARAFAAKHGVKRSYDSYEKMLQDPELQVVYIGTPNGLHAGQAIQASNAGKNVITEKPMALSAADCEKMIAAAEKNYVKIGVDFQNRFHPAHVEARRLIASGQVGDIFYASAQLGSGGGAGSRKGWKGDFAMAGAGALMGNGLHPMDLLRFLLGSEVVSVTAIMDDDPKTQTLDEMDFITLEFENGAHGEVVAGVKIPRSFNNAIVYGNDARIVTVNTVGRALQGKLEVDGDTLKIRNEYNDVHPESGNYKTLIEAFNKSIKDNSEFAASGKQGLEIARITEAVIKSAHLKRAVKISR